MSTTPESQLPLPRQEVILKHREVMASALASKSRAQGGGLWFSVVLLFLLWFAISAGHFAAFVTVQQLPFEVMFTLGPWLPGLLTAIFALVAVKLALDFEQRRVSRAYLARLAAIGAPLERVGTYEVTPEALVLTTERVVVAPRWHALDTLERGKHGWVLSADQLHFLIPFADFADADAQRRLLAAVTSRMTSEARARSREAVEFAENAQEPPMPAASPLGGSHTSPVKERGQAPEARGWLTQEQAGWASGVVYGKVVRPGFHRWAYPLTGAVAGLVLGGFAAGLLVALLPSPVFVRFPMLALLGWLILFAGGALGLAYGHKRLAILFDKAWRGGLEARGVPQQIEARWHLTETGVGFETARFTAEAPYASIHQLLHEHGYWILGADAQALCIPDTAFASPDSARAFMAQVLSQMSEPARARSVTLEDPVPSAS